MRMMKKVLGTVNCQFLREKSRSLLHTLHLMLIEILCLLHIFPVFQPGQNMQQLQHFQPKIAGVRHRMRCVKL